MNRCEIRSSMTYAACVPDEVGLLTCIPHPGSAEELPSTFLACLGSCTPYCIGYSVPNRKLKLMLLALSFHQRYSLNHYLLLLRIDSALRVLGGDGNHAFAGRKWGHEIVKATVGPDHRHLVPVYHDPRTGLSFSCHLNDMSMLNQRVDVEENGAAIRLLGNDGEAVLLALYRLLVIGIKGLDHPIVRAFRQAGDHYRR